MMLAKNDVAAQSDYLEILNLYARLNRAWDEGDVATFVACFGSDASYERPFVGDGLMTVGHSELTELARKHASNLSHSEPKRHLSCNVIIEVGEDTATGTCDHFVITAGSPGNPPRFHSTGRCEDRFHRTDAGWKLSRRIKNHDFIE